MRVFFGGGEVAAHRKLLTEQSVEHIAVNLSAYFTQNQKARMDVEVYGGYHIVVYASSAGIDLLRVSNFIDANIDLIDFVYDLPSDVAIADGKYVPEWQGGDAGLFYEHAARYGQVGIADLAALDDSAMQPIKAFARSKQISLWTASSKSNVVGQGVWSNAVISGWLNAQKQRELQVWDGRQVSRFNRDRREAAAEKNRGQIERLGHTAELVIEGDVHETMALAVTSWRQYELQEAPVIAIDSKRHLHSVASGSGGEIAISRPEPRQRERGHLPVLTPQEPATDEEGAQTGKHAMTVSPSPLRACDPCSLNQHCPRFEAGASCAFSIPVVIRTKDELSQVMGSLLEIQTQRVLMARFAEDLLSQGVDQTVSAELERFFRMVKAMKEINDNRDTLTIVAKTASESGALSRVFGARAGAAQRSLTGPDGTEIDAIEAVLVDET